MPEELMPELLTLPIYDIVKCHYSPPEYLLASEIKEDLLTESDLLHHPETSKPRPSKEPLPKVQKRWEAVLTPVLCLSSSVSNGCNMIQRSMLAVKPCFVPCCHDWVLDNVLFFGIVRPPDRAAGC